MGRLSIEDKVRQALSGHKQPIDKQELFDSLGIGEEDRRRPVVWWFFGTMAVLFMVGSLFYIYMDVDHTRDHELAVLPSTTPSVEMYEKPLQEVKVSEDSAGLLGDIIIEATTQPIAENEEKVSTAIEQATVASPHMPVATELASKSQRLSNWRAGAMTRQLKANTNINNGGNLLSDMPLQGTEHALASSVDDYPLTTSMAVLSVSEIDRLSHQVHYDIAKFTIDQDFALIEPLQAPAKNLYLSTYVEYGRPYRQLTAMDRLGEGLVDVRNEEESVIDYFASGILVHRPLSRSWSLHAGIDFLSISEQFSVLVSDSTDVPATQISQLTDYDGQVSTSESPGVGLQVIDRLWTYNNQYTRVSIPIGVAYNIDRGAWSFVARASALLGVTTARRGHEYLSDRSVGEINQRSSIGLSTSFLCSADLQFQINPQWQIGVGPVFRWDMRDRSVQSIQADYRSIGGSVSVYRSW